MASNVVWTSSSTCDICRKDCGSVLYDAVTKYGPWATMCEDCWNKHSIHALGPGLGQRYELKDGKYIKTKGWEL